MQSDIIGIDKTFGENGVTDEYVAGDDSAFAVQVLPDKKILLETAGEVGVRSSPFRVHSPAWRLELIGSGAGAMGTVVLG